METILNQTRQDFELILLDDASKDGSAEFLETFARDPRVRFIPNKQNSGSPFAQWNRGLNEASGQLVWIAESDDVASPELLETLAGILDENESLGLACCDSNRINEDGIVLPRKDIASDDLWNTGFQVDGRTAVREHLYLENKIVSASAVVFRREIYDKAGPADKALTLAGDWMQWSKMLLLSDMCFVPKTLSGTRIHTNTRRHSTASNGTLELESLTVQERLRSSLIVDRASVRMAADRVAKSWLQGMRAGRFSGSLQRHPQFFLKLLRTEVLTAVRFSLSWPYAFLVWLIKRFVFPFRYGKS